MSEHIQQTIATLQEQLRKHLEAAAETKRVINSLCRTVGRAPIYADEEQIDHPANIRRDQWYGQPLSTAIREYLTMRRSANQGPATVNEIHDALVLGGYEFEAKDDDNAKRGLRVSLTKNTAIFHRLPGGNTFGLIEWYPNAKRERQVADDQQKDQVVRPALPASPKEVASG